MGNVVEVLKDLSSELFRNKQTGYEASFQNGNLFGEIFDNGTWTGMIGATINNETDIAGPFYVTEERSRFIEYSVPLGFNKLGIVSGLTHTNKGPFVIFGIFSIQVWFALVASLLFVPLVACIIHEDLPSSIKRYKTKIFVKYYWAFQTSLLGQGFGSCNTSFLRSAHKSFGLKIIQCTWFIAACFIVMNIYKSSITSSFAASKLVTRIETLDQLVNDTDIEIGTYRHSYTYSFVKNLIGSPYEMIYHRVKKNLYPNINASTPEWMDAVENGKLVFIAPLSQLKNHVGERFLETGKCGLRVTEMHLGSSSIALIFAKHYRNSKLLREFNSFILRFNEGNIAHREFLHSDLYYDICSAARSTVTKPLERSDLFGSFIIFGVGMMASIVTFIMELIWNPYSIVKRSKGKTELGGIAKQIYEGMAAVKGLDYEASFQDGNVFGEIFGNGTWTGMIGATINNETDIAGPFYITEERSQFVKYSVPLGFNKLGLLSGLTHTNKHPSLIFGIFSIQVWFALVASLLFVPLVACISHEDFPSPIKWSKTDIFVKYYWAFQASLLGQACFIIMNIYKSSITSSFAASKLVTRIETLDQLVKDTDIEIGTYRHSYTYSFVKNLIGSPYESIYHRVKKNLYPNINVTTPEWMDLVENGGLIFIADVSQLKNHVGERFLETGKCGLRVTEMHLGSSSISLIFGEKFHGSKILNQFNQFILRFNEGNIAHREFLHSNLYYDICSATGSAITKALELSDLLGAFIIFVVGMWNPWVIYGKGNGTPIRGVAIEIYETMKTKRIFDYEIQSGALYGGSVINKKWTGLMGALISNVTDVGGPIFVSEERAQHVEFVTPIAFGKLALLSGMVNANKNPYLVFGIFSVQVWIAILLSIFLASGAACLIYYFIPSTRTKNTWEAFLRFLWNFQSSLLGKEFGANSFFKHILKTPSFKLLQGIWILSCLVLTYTYQGTIISTYAADKMKAKYESFEDVLADPKAAIGTFENSYPLLCLSKLENTELEEIWTRIQRNLLKPVTDVPSWLDPVEDGKVVYLFDEAYSKFMIGERFRKTGKCGIRVSAIDTCSGFIAFLTRKGLSKDLISKLNEGILRFNEGALPTYHMAETVLFYEICSHKGMSVSKALDLTDLIGAFTVLGTGLAISILYFMVEMAIGRAKRKSK
ncbi:hypothetical protein JTE90_013956 [Oedothorax gibbosus]|uniref:Ionotropic glutamate receptor L-glutamate and glycine-binding domain-containing protein n=1 Tax=Oedothorax gibbosus TaxID=931172 RepID=A0AAV6UCD2_9ARAC|nr:hypothetical protein JTE90_013956 [Oedothorax gibbosus]